MTTLRWLAAAALIPLAGCYSYAPLGREALQPQVEVRAHLTRSGAADIAAPADVSDLLIDGEVVRWDEDDLRVAVWRADLRTGTRFQPQRQTLSIPWAAIAGLEQRRLSYWKTGALLGGAAVAAALIVRSVFHGGGGGGDPINGGGSTF